MRLGQSHQDKRIGPLSVLDQLLMVVPDPIGNLKSIRKRIRLESALSTDQDFTAVDGDLPG
jgi:hypothetical protein